MFEDAISFLALTCIARLGDVFTDASESRASVAAAENLVALAERLTRASEESASTEKMIAGSLFLNGELASSAHADVDGSLHLPSPLGTVAKGQHWSWKSAESLHLSVTFFQGESSLEDQWVITDPQFYPVIFRGLV